MYAPIASWTRFGISVVASSVNRRGAETTGAVTVPIRGGRLALGTWQGIYLGEHRDHGGARTVVVTLMGQER